MGARRVSRSSRSSKSSSSKSKSISFSEFKKRVERGDYGRAKITTRSGGSKKETVKTIKPTKKGKVQVKVETKQRSTVFRPTGTTREIVTQTGERMQIRSGSDGRIKSFERIGLTSDAVARRKRIKTGTARAKDIYAGVDTSTARGRARVLQRLQPALRKRAEQDAQARAKATARGRALMSKAKTPSVKPQDYKTVSQTLGVSFSPRLSISQNLSRYKTKLNKNQSKLTQADVNRLGKWADKINQRGEQLTQQEQAFIGFLKNSINNLKKGSDRVLNKLPKPIADLGKLGTKASQRLNNYFINMGVGMAYTPARISQAIEKALFVENLRATSRTKGENRKFWKSLLKESTRTSPYVQKALRDAFKDPATYVFPLIGAKFVKNEVAMIVDKPPRSGSNVAKALDGLTIADKKGNLYASVKGNIVSKTSGKSRKNRPITKTEKSKRSRGLDIQSRQSRKLNDNFDKSITIEKQRQTQQPKPTDKLSTKQLKALYQFEFNKPAGSMKKADLKRVLNRKYKTPTGDFRPFSPVELKAIGINLKKGRKRVIDIDRKGNVKVKFQKVQQNIKKQLDKKDLLNIN